MQCLLVYCLDLTMGLTLFEYLFSSSMVYPIIYYRIMKFKAICCDKFNLNVWLIKVELLSFINLFMNETLILFKSFLALKKCNFAHKRRLYKFLHFPMQQLFKPSSKPHGYSKQYFKCYESPESKVFLFFFYVLFLYFFL